MLGFFKGLGMGLRGMSGPMQTAAGAAGVLGGAWGRTIGLGAKDVAMGRMGMTAAGALWGGAGGAAWGMVSDDTSVIGGAIGGAGLGAIGTRYVGAGVKGVMRANRAAARIGAPRWPASQLARRAGGAMLGQLKGDALLVSNKGINAFSAMQSRVRGMTI